MSEALERLIDQGVGREPAEIVLKGGRFFDLVTGGTRCLRHRHLGWAYRRHLRRLSGPRGDRRHRPRHRAGLHRYASPHRIVAGDAARVRPLRAAAWCHHCDLRSARDRQCARHRRHPVFPGFGHGDDHGHPRPTLLLRAGYASRNLGRRPTGGAPYPLSQPPEGDRACRVHEFSGCRQQGSDLPCKTRCLPGWAYRRPCPPSFAERN